MWLLFQSCNEYPLRQFNWYDYIVKSLERQVLEKYPHSEFSTSNSSLSQRGKGAWVFHAVFQAIINPKLSYYEGIYALMTFLIIHADND